MIKSFKEFFEIDKGFLGLLEVIAIIGISGLLIVFGVIFFLFTIAFTFGL